MYRYLNQFKISHRLWLMAAISILCLITVYTLGAYQLRDNLLVEKQSKIRHIVEAVYGALEYFHTQEQQGKLSKEAAQVAAMGLIQQVRYGTEEYFWLNDMQSRMIMHPYEPQLEGKNLANFKDPTGKRLFVEMVNKVKQDQAGYVHYQWTKPGENIPTEKISYVKGFSPWGWIIGSGIYLDDLHAAYWHHWRDSLVGLLIIVSIMALISTILAKSITNPLQRAAIVLNKLASGDADLTEGLDITGRSETSELARGFNHFVENLHNLVNQLMKTSETLLVSTNQVTSIAHDTNLSADQQRSESDQVATAMTELHATACDVAKNAAQAATAAEQANSMALDSTQVVTSNAASITHLHDSIQDTTDVIRKLQTGSEEIGGIVQTIQAISEQTNLLALNAAIEAARAGEQGRGFAVVADEVRELAKRTQDATLEIEKMISKLQQGAEQAVKTVESGKLEAESSVEHAQQTGKVLEEIVTVIAHITEMNVQIATVAEEQSAVIGEINQNAVRITEIANQNAQGASNTVSAADNIGTQLNELMKLATSFRLSHQDASFNFSAARSAHLAWVGRVEAHLDGNNAISDDELVSHHECAFGEWYYGPGLTNYGHMEVMRQLEAPHEQLHHTICECVALERQGDHAGAREKLMKLDQLSKQILELLHKVEQEITSS